MILNCPSCSASFKVDPTLLGKSGRSVRCGNCGHSWHQVPGGTEAGPGEATQAGRAQLARQAKTLDKAEKQRLRNRARRPVVARRTKPASGTIGWLVLGVFVAAICTGALLARNEIMALVPGTEPIYEQLGLKAAVGEGLDLRDVTSVRRTVDGENALVIKGVIVNVSSRPRAVPRLRASLTDSQGKELTNWVFASDSDDLPPGGLTTFETRTVNPPGAGELHLVFIE